MRVWGIQNATKYEMYMNNSTNTQWCFNGGRARTIDARDSFKVVKYTGDDGKVYLDGTQLSTESLSGDTGKTLWLFRGNDRYSNIYIAHCKIWVSKVLVRELIPVKRLLDNKICMYDKVSDTFFTNEGTGEFIAGPEI